MTYSLTSGLIATVLGAERVKGLIKGHTLSVTTFEVVIIKVLRSLLFSTFENKMISLRRIFELI